MKNAMMSARTMHSRICAKSHATRRAVFHRPVFHSSSPREMVVVGGERPFVDVLETLDFREWGGVRVRGGGLWERSILCGVCVCVKVKQEDGRWEVCGGDGGMRWRPVAHGFKLVSQFAA